MLRVDLEGFMRPSGPEEVPGWAKYRSDPEREYPEDSYLLRRDGVPCLASGDVQAVTGAAKSGKSFACLVFAAAVLRDSYLGFEAVKPGRRVLWIDTEMSPRDVNKRHRALLRLAGLSPEERADRLEVLMLGTVEGRKNSRGKVLETENHVRKSLVFGAARNLRPDLLILDGVRDICTDFNDMAESSGLVLDLRRLAVEVGCAIVMVLHENPTGDKMRGHLGTELLNKASEVYRVKLKADADGRYMSVETAASRNQPAGRWSFRIEDGVPVEAEIIDLNPEESKQAERDRAIELAFYHREGIRRGDLEREVAETLGCTDRTARTRISEAVADGVICKEADGLYHLVRNEIEEEDNGSGQGGG